MCGSWSTTARIGSGLLGPRRAPGGYLEHQLCVDTVHVHMYDTIVRAWRGDMHGATSSSVVGAGSVRASNILPLGSCKIKHCADRPGPVARNCRGLISIRNTLRATRRGAKIELVLLFFGCKRASEDRFEEVRETIIDAMANI